MAAAAQQNQVDLAMSHEPKLATPMYEIDEKKALDHRHSVSDDFDAAPVEFEADLEGEEPTEEELRTLPRISGKIPWIIFTVAFVELCERFGYYGCQVLCMFLHSPNWLVPSTNRRAQTPTSSSDLVPRGPALAATPRQRASPAL